MKDKLEKAAAYIKDARERLKEVVSRYKAEYVQATAHSLFDIKIEFITLEDEFSQMVTRSKQLALTANRDWESAKYAKRLELRKSANATSWEEAKLKSCQDVDVIHLEFTSLEAEITLDMMRDLKNTARSYKDDCIQRISVVKTEEFNVRNL